MKNRQPLLWTPVLWVAVALATGAAVSSSRAHAQTSSADAARTALDKVYSTAQAGRGEEKFNLTCSACHVLSDVTGAKFRSRWDGQSVGDVFDFISSAMPDGDPGSLSKEEYANILAYFLKESGYPAGESDLPTDSAVLSKVKIVPVAK